MIKKRGGLVIKLSEEHPTLIKIAGQEIKVYLSHNSDGQVRARFIASDEVTILGPHRVKKASSHTKLVGDSTHGI